MNYLLLQAVVRQALNEDLQFGDITTAAIFDQNQWTAGVFLAKEEGILAGLPVMQEVFAQLNPAIKVTAIKTEGAGLHQGDFLAEIQGPVQEILTGERVALNFLQRLSGIATKTFRLGTLIKDYPAKIVDTRKTTPGLRMLEKYAVTQGGGTNHRFSLGDAVLIKDNHIAACGSITEAVRRARTAIPHTMKIEVETETGEQVQEALAAGADIIMLDNMSPDLLTQMVNLIGKQAIVEASGKIDEHNIVAIAKTGVDLISCGSLTHSVKALDISLDLK